MNTSDQDALHLDMTLQRYKDQLRLLDRQGRAYNAGARRFLQRRMQYLINYIAAITMSKSLIPQTPPVKGLAVDHTNQAQAMRNH